MIIDELKAKIDRGEELTESDRDGLFVAMQKEFEDIKQKDPARYLKMLQDITDTFVQLRKDLAQIKQ